MRGRITVRDIRDMLLHDYQNEEGLTDQLIDAFDLDIPEDEAVELRALRGSNRLGIDIPGQGTFVITVTKL